MSELGPEDRTARLAAEDAAARGLAQRSFDRPLVLEAGAGTGKTAALVARVLAWCLAPGWERAEAALRERRKERGPTPERIAARVLSRVVAITFTEAAAAEMASRIGGGLRSLERGELPRGLDASVLPEEPALGRRARALRGALDHLFADTIHAWCRRLLAAYPLEAGLHPRLEVDADGRIARETVRELLEQRLREACAVPDDPVFAALAAHEIGPRELEAELLALIDTGVPARALADDPFAAERVASAGARLAARLDAFLREEGGALASSGSSVAAETCEAVVQTRERLHRTPLADRADLAALLAWLPEVWDERRVKRLGEWGRGKLGQGESRSLGARAERLAGPAARLAALLRHLLALDVPRFEAGRALVAGLLAEAEARLRARGAIGFSGLLTGARELLARRPDVAARVAAGVDQLLVDEFQDTDRRQCGILRAVALAGPAETRPGLFLVGDPKQSIYGWRNADLAAYESFVADVLAAGGALARLSVNFRSVPAILDEVERIVAPVMEEEPGVQPAFQPLVPSAANAGAPGFARGTRAPVEYWVPAAWDAEAAAPARTLGRDAARLEAAALARDLHALHEEEGVPRQQCVVLFRSRGDWDVYLEALRSAGVPYAVEGDRSYYQRREVIDAAALVRCVLDPNDSLALLATLRSAAVGLPDAAIVPLWARGLPARMAALHHPDPEALVALRALVAEAAAALPGDVPGLDRVAGWEHALVHALEVVAHLRRSFAEDAADVFVEQLRAGLLVEAGEAARALGAWRVANLDRFFRELAGTLAAGADAHAVVRALRSAVLESLDAEEGRPRELHDDAVRVMTIHGAKGLDFEHVYLMQLHKGSRPGAGEGPCPGEVDGRLELRLFGAASLSWDCVQELRERVEAAERVRTLYVAMTRAKQRFALAGLWPEVQQRGARGQAMELVERRAPAPALDAWMAELVEAGGDRLDAAGARWVFPALALPAAGEPEARVRVSLPSAAAVAAASRGLLAARAAARERMERPFAGAVSAHVPRPHVGRGTLRADVAADPVIARAVGTAVHRALEALDLSAGPAWPAAARAAAERALPGLVPPASREPALRELRALLLELERGALLARLRALADHVVARELPVLLPPEEGQGGVACQVGAVDLVYRDPETGEWVVADYKTDREERPEYAAQVERYGRALREALALERDPRRELWYLALGRIAAC